MLKDVRPSFVSVSLLPDYLEKTPPPAIAIIRLSDRFATWDFQLLRRRGRMPPPCRDLIRWITKRDRPS